jgi:hypothetical protein
MRIDKDSLTGEADGQPSRISRAQSTVIALAITLTGGAFLYRLLLHKQLGRSSAMFLGLPMVLAILLVLTSKTKTVTGSIIQGITLALLLMAPLLGEGYLCILMASPLFYLVGTLIGVAVDWQRRRRKATLGCVALAILPMCLEGVIPQLTLDRRQTVEVSRVINAPVGAVEVELAKSPKIQMQLPQFLRIGFPRPLEAYGEGLFAGATRTLHFSGAEGDPPGDLVTQVVERRPGFARMATVSDSSKLTQWVKWNWTEVEWKAIDETHTRVTWRVRFERELDPAWYFAPLERAAVHEAAAYMIQANATPIGRD